MNYILNLLKPTGNYTYHQVQHSKILYAEYIARYFFVWLSEQTVTVALHIIITSVFITEAESVYSAVRPDSLYEAITFRP